MVANGTHPGVNLIGFAASMTGLGTFARMVADLLIAEGVPLNIVPIGQKVAAVAADEDLAPYRRYFSGEPVHRINLFVFGADFGATRYQLLRGPMQMAGRFNVLMPFWELGEYPESLLALHESIDLFLAPTRFIQHGLMQHLRRARVDHLPMAALDTSRLPSARPDGNRPFCFFFNFDMLSSVARKNPGLLLQAYAELFAADPSTRLVLKVSGMGHPRAQAFLQRIEAARQRVPGLEVVTERLPRARMLALIAQADAYVSCHRGEGLGLGLLEAMSMGVPCIATAYGGNTDFMTHDNSMLLRYELEPVQCPQYERILAGKPALWARPALGDLKAAMAALRSDGALRARLAANGQRDARRYIEASWGSRLGSLLQSAAAQAQGR